MYRNQLGLVSNMYEIEGALRFLCIMFNKKTTLRIRLKWQDVYTPNISARIHDVFEELTEREQEVLTLYYGLRSAPLKMEGVGRKFNLTRQRISQIIQKAKRKLRHPVRMSKLYDVADMLFSTTYLKDVEGAEKIQVGGPISTELFSMSIQEVEFSIKAHNFLSNANINTLGEITQKTEAEFLKYRGCRKSIMIDIKQVLNKYGLSLACNN